MIQLISFHSLSVTMTTVMMMIISFSFTLDASNYDSGVVLGRASRTVTETYQASSHLSPSEEEIKEKQKNKKRNESTRVLGAAAAAAAAAA